MNKKLKTKKTKKRRPASKAVHEYTAGGMVFRRLLDTSNVEILLIQDPKKRWTIPKGHVEPGESLEQTAVREIREETGLVKLKIRDKLDKINFFYRLNGKLIFMTTHVFLIEALGDSSNLIPEDSEGIVDAKWFPAEEALGLIAYKQTEKLFRIGLEKLGVASLA